MHDSTTPERHSSAPPSEEDPDLADDAVLADDAGPAGDAGPADAEADPRVASGHAGGGAGGDGQRRLAGAGLVLLAVAVAFGGGVLVGRASIGSAGPTAAVVPPSSAPGTTPVPGASGGLASLPSDGPWLGRPDAKVVMDYWADYQCPFCARFARDVLPQLASRIADGTLAVRHRDYAFIGTESDDAAVAVRCAAREDRYWEMHDAVYAAQSGENQGAFARDRLALVAASVGLDATSFTACLDELAPYVEVLDDTAAGVRTGIASTPTVDVNGTRFLGVSDVSRLLAAIDAAAAGASPAALPTPAPSPDPWTGTPTDGRMAGPADAPVTVQLWMDYQSADSPVVATDLEPELRTRIAAGAIRVEQHDLATLGADSVTAATFVACIAAQRGNAWFMHDVLAANASGPGAGVYTERNLLRFGARLGIDIRAAAACMDGGTSATAVAADTEAGRAAGITVAPTIIVLRGDAEVARFEGKLDVKQVLAAIDAATP